MKQTLLTAALLMLTVYVSAQSLAPAAVTASATKMTQSNGSLSFTVGELVVETHTDGNGNALGGGFTNGSTSSTTVTSVQQPDEEKLMVNVYPNPTADMLTLDVQHIDVDAYTITIFDVSGKQVYTANHSGISGRININLSSFESGTYLLNLISNKQETLGTYQVVRN
jgi:hypothetical protein